MTYALRKRDRDCASGELEGSYGEPESAVAGMVAFRTADNTCESVPSLDVSAKLIEAPPADSNPRHLRCERTVLDDVVPTKTGDIEPVDGVACTTACTGSTKAECQSRDDGGQASHSEFTAAMLMIAGLPLSDREKAEAVRRLLAGTRG